jgi:ComF family protein
MNLLGLVFPKDLYCVSCGRPLPKNPGNGLALCEECLNEFPWVSGRLCNKCGRPLAEENQSVFCRECKKTGERYFRKAMACSVYSGKAAELVREMKYRGKAWYSDTISSLMAFRYFAEADPETGELPVYDFIVSVPMSAVKKAHRGYDQTELIAAGLSRKINVPYLKKVLRRVRDTDVMSSLSAYERRMNLDEAFLVPYDMIQIAEGKRILLADDVYTTGSSADACAKTLLASGAGSVDVIVFGIGADVRSAEDRTAVVESPGQLRAKGPT